jgi:hypothetical protein
MVSAAALPAAAQDQPVRAAAQAAEAKPEAAPADRAGPPRATAADLRVGAQVFGGDGKQVGTVEATDEGGAVVTTGSARARLNLDAFYKSDKGLLIGYSRGEFEAMAGGTGGPEAAEE